MPASKTSRKATSKKADAPEVILPEVKLSSVYATYASRHDIDTTAAAKRVRSRLRANFDKVCELSPNVTIAKQSANDGNRWPQLVTSDLAAFINPPVE